jgi:hypothetical protein
MTRKPPTPIMDSDIETKPHPWLPGHIDKHWEEDHNSPYLKGTGMVRRPDVIIVKDPNKPPTHDNIKQVVEIKFPPDKMDRAQEEAYTRIAGDETKLVVMGPDDCDCNQKDPDGSKIPVEQMGTAVTLTGILYMLLTKRPSPVPVY